MRAKRKEQQEEEEDDESEYCALNLAALMHYDAKASASNVKASASIVNTFPDSDEDADFEGSAVELSPISAGSLSITPQFLPPSLRRRLQSDASKLYRAGAFRTGKMIGRRAEKKNKGYRMCDVCDLFDDAIKAKGVGEMQAREDLFGLMVHLREMLADELGRPIEECMELQYLRNPIRKLFLVTKHETVTNASCIPIPCQSNLLVDG
jgi:hypothetical protein